MATTQTPAQPLPNPVKPKPGYEQPEEVAFHRIRITLTSRNVKSLEKGNSTYDSINRSYNYCTLFFILFNKNVVLIIRIVGLFFLFVSL